MKKIVAIHQPNFAPWMGFFDKVSEADVLVVLDKVSYSKNAMINRNKIKTSQGEKWLTVPVKAHLGQEIREVEIDNTQNWRAKHLKTIEQNYHQSSNFKVIFPLISKIYQKNHQKLIDLNMDILLLCLRLLKIKSKIIFQSKLGAEGISNDLLIDIAKKVHGTTYLTGTGSKDYLDPKLFAKENIEIVWQKYEPRKYKQLHGAFIANLSVLDYLFCVDLDID